MNELWQTLLNSQRVTRQQKRDFLHFILRQMGKAGHTEGCSFWGFLSENMIIGDVDTAETIIMAAYDTPHTRVFGAPQYLSSAVMSILSRLIPAALLGALVYLSGAMLTLHPAAIVTVFFVLIFACSFMIPNKYNYNCNTSGVLALTSLVQKHSASTVAFVFLDNGDFFSLGRRAFFKAYKENLRQKKIVELYCIGGYGELVCTYGSTPPPKAIPAIHKKKRRQSTLSRASHTRLGYTIHPIKTAADKSLDPNQIYEAVSIIEREYL